MSKADEYAVSLARLAEDTGLAELTGGRAAPAVGNLCRLVRAVEAAARAGVRECNTGADASEVRRRADRVCRELFADRFRLDWSAGLWPALVGAGGWANGGGSATVVHRLEIPGRP